MFISCTVDQSIRIEPETLSPKEPIVIRVNEFDEKSAQKFAKQVSVAEEMCQPIIPIVIDSYGGNPYSLFAMIDVIKACRSKIMTVVEGKAMSCGAVLFACGEDGYRFISPHGTIMVHDAIEIFEGSTTRKSEDLKSDAAELARINEILFGILDSASGKMDGYFTKLVTAAGRSDLYLNANDAVRHGLANHVGVPSIEVEITANFKLTLARSSTQLATLTADVPLVKRKRTNCK